jgi:hypothetical protein
LDVVSWMGRIRSFDPRLITMTGIHEISRDPPTITKKCPGLAPSAMRSFHVCSNLLQAFNFFFVFWKTFVSFRGFCLSLSHFQNLTFATMNDPVQYHNFHRSLESFSAWFVHRKICICIYFVPTVIYYGK